VKPIKRFIGVVGIVPMMLFVIVCWVITGNDSWAEQKLYRFLHWAEH